MDSRPTGQAQYGTLLSPSLYPSMLVSLWITGVSTSKDRIVEISVLRVDPDGSETARTVRVHPGMAIPPGATKIHGITDADVEAEPPFRAYAKGFAVFLEGCDLVGYNIKGFDLPLLLAEFERADVEFSLEGRCIVDPMIIFHRQEPRTLSAALQKYTGQAHESAHESMADVKAAWEILDAQVAQYPELGSTMADLHAFCHEKDPDWIDADGKLIATDNGPTISFGKYAGQLLEDLATSDPGYLQWILSKDFTAEVKDVVRGALGS